MGGCSTAHGHGTTEPSAVPCRAATGLRFFFHRSTHPCIEVWTDGHNRSQLHSKSAFAEVVEEGKRRCVEHVLIVAKVAEKEIDFGLEFSGCSKKKKGGE